MRHWAAILLIATCTLTVGATVRVFATDFAEGFGLPYPTHALTPSFSSVDAVGNNTNAYDYSENGYELWAAPPINWPSGTLASPCEVHFDSNVYIWFQFRDEPSGAKVDRLTVAITGPSSVTTCYYVQNDMGAWGKKRWDGQVTQPEVPEFKHNPQTLVASTANGIVNGNNSSQFWNMFHHQSGSGTNPYTGVALLGAADGEWGEGLFSVAITEISYSNAPDPTIGAPAYFGDIPEPTTLLLLGVGGALIRRREAP